MRRFVVLLAALALFAVACSDDSGSDGSEGSTDEPPIVDPSGEVDTEALTEELRTAILGDSGETFDPELEVREAVVDSTGATGLIVGPVDTSATLSQDDAHTVCSAVATVVLRALPTAVTIIVDGDGTPLVATVGAGGSCEDVEGSIDDVIAEASGG